jgi:hypothetical protein
MHGAYEARIAAPEIEYPMCSLLFSIVSVTRDCDEYIGASADETSAASPELADRPTSTAVDYGVDKPRISFWTSASVLTVSVSNGLSLTLRRCWRLPGSDGIRVDVVCSSEVPSSINGKSSFGD